MFKIGDEVVFIQGSTTYDRRVWKVKRLTKIKDQVLLSRAIGGRLWHPIGLLRKATRAESKVQQRIDTPEPECV